MAGEPPSNLPVENNPEPVKELLKREEIRTMEKDIVKLREGEAQKERVKITEIKTQPPISKPQAATSTTPAPVPSTTKPATPPDTLIPPKAPLKKTIFPKKPLIIRGAIAVICLTAIGFFAVYALNRPKVTPAKAPAAASQATTTLPLAQEPETTTAPLPLVPVEKKIEVNRQELARTFPIELPEEILSKLEDNYTLASFEQKEGQRLALIAKTKDKTGLIRLLKDWETKATSTLFRTASSQGTLFRYLTLSKNDLGVCYLVLDDYFVLTTSFGSMQKVIQELNLRKKVGQLFLVGFDGASVTPQLEDFFKKYKPGGVLLLAKNIENATQLKSLTSQLQDLSRRETGQALFIAVDQEGGPISRIGWAGELTPQKEIKNKERAGQIGQARGQELKNLGININLAPVLDWATSGDFVFDRTFQKPATTTGELAETLIAGQKTAGIFTTVKHFPGYSNITFNPEDDLAELEKIPEISQFKKAQRANPEFVMTSNVVYKEIDAQLPFGFSPKSIQFLKDNLGQASLVMTDDLSQNSLLKKFSLKEIVVDPIEAGADILLLSGYRLPVEKSLDEFMKAYLSGSVSSDKISQAVDRIIKLKQKLLK